MLDYTLLARTQCHIKFSEHRKSILTATCTAMPPKAFGFTARTFEYISTHPPRAPGSAAMILLSTLLIRNIRPKPT
jgi:hypothetical protein